MHGRIARLTERGYGFITPDDGKDVDVFFHSNELDGIMFHDLIEGDEVDFNIIEGTKGPCAVSIARNGRPADEDIDDEDTEVGIAVQNMCICLAEIVAKNPDALEEIEWRDLERLLAEVFSGLGFSVELKEGSKDGAEDVIVIYIEFNVRKTFTVQIKHWRSGKRVGVQNVDEFIHVIAREKRDGGLFVATYGYSEKTIEHITEINRDNIGFGTHEKVVALCRNYVRAREGTWYPPSQIDKVIFEDTIYFPTKS